MPFLVRDGIRIHYQVRGEGVPLLMCNGYGPPLEWVTELYMPNFVDRFQCATYDLRGMGRSDGPEDDSAYDIREIARDGLAVMDELGWKTAHLWGASMGSSQATTIAILAPERVRSLTICGINLGAPNMFQKKYEHIVQGRMKYATAIAMQKDDPQEASRRACQFYFTPELLAKRSDIVDLVAKITSDTPAHRIWPAYQKLLDLIKAGKQPTLPDHADPDPNAFPIWKHVHEINVPTLLMHGENDPIIHPDCARFAFEQIPNAELRILKPFYHSFSGSPEIQREQSDWIWMQEENLKNTAA